MHVLWKRLFLGASFSQATFVQVLKKANVATTHILDKLGQITSVYIVIQVVKQRETVTQKLFNADCFPLALLPGAGEFCCQYLWSQKKKKKSSVCFLKPSTIPFWVTLLRRQTRKGGEQWNVPCVFLTACHKVKTFHSRDQIWWRKAVVSNWGHSATPQLASLSLSFLAFPA